MAAVVNATADLTDLRVTGLISLGHFFSHLYILALPPIFPVLQTDLGIGATQLGLAIAAANVVTMLLQAPTGFLVDRIGPARILIAGHMIFALAIAAIGLVGSWPSLLLLMAVAGLGNAVYHPADYAILSARVSPGRMGRAFSVHTFGGYAGFAAAPLTMVPLTELFGWRTALLTVGLAGVAAGLLLLAFRGELAALGHRTERRQGGNAGGSLRLLTSLPVLLALLFFVLLSASHTGIVSFSPAALTQLYGLSLVEANLPVTAYLVVSALGVLMGGQLADRTSRHTAVVAACSITIALVAVLVAGLELRLPELVAVFAIAGLAGGVIAPSRDMLVRAVTPPGASGKVFGFVMTGFNIGSLLAPPAYGLLLDHGSPDLMFWAVAAFSLLTILTVAGAARRAQAR